MITDDFYALLGLTPSASAEEIRKAYRKLVLDYHPDRNPGDPLAEDRFKRIGEAYHTLADEEARARYDNRRMLFERAQKVPESSKETEEAAFFARMEKAEAARDRRQPAVRSLSNRFDGRDAVLGSMVGAMVCLAVAPFFLDPPAQTVSSVAFVPLFAGPCGALIATETSLLVDSLWDALFDRYPDLDFLPQFVGPVGAWLAIGGAVSTITQHLGNAAPEGLWAGTFAAAVCAWGMAALGRAFALAATGSWQRRLAFLVALLSGGISGTFLGFFAMIPSLVHGVELRSYDGLFSAGLSGGLGAALASARGAFRRPSKGE